MRIAVIGAGIVGTSIAFKLQRAGHLVTIFDRARPGEGGASQGNAGHIAASDIFPLGGPNIALTGLKMLLDPYAPLKISPAYALRLLPWLIRFQQTGTKARFRRASEAMQILSQGAVEATESLFRDAEMTDMLKRIPALYVYESVETLEHSKSLWAQKQHAGHPSRFISRKEITVLEPALAPVFAGGCLSLDWAQVRDPLVVVRKLFEAAYASGVVSLQTGVLSIEPSESEVVLVADTTRHPADIVVVAAGLGSKLLAGLLGERLPVEAEGGYNITYRLPGVTVERPVVFADRGMVSSTLESGLRIGGWAEYAGADAPAKSKYFERIEELGRRFYPSLKTEGGVKWSGKRPSMPDSVPVISRSDISRRIIYATGHGHYGLTWSARTAEIVQRMIDENIDMAAFSIRRFH